VIEVTTARIGRGTIQVRVSAPGSLLARRESRIGAEVRGRIQEVFVREGDRVEAGDPLFQIDPKTYQVTLRQAEAGLDLARSERRQIEADFERSHILHGKDVVSIDELDRVETQVAVAKARERQAAEAVAMARHDLEQTLVVAPFDGSIAERRADEGTTALVQPQTIVIVLQETSVLEAEANLPEGQLAVVRVGDVARVYVEGLPEPIETRVASVGDTIDPDTRTYRVDMLVPNPDHRLKAGAFAHIDIEPQAKRQVILVPRDALRSAGGRTRVLVVREGRAQAIPVRLGVVSGDYAEVLGGITVDSEVIVGEAARSVAPGMHVRVAPSRAKPTS
jgi:RND family efflux transporter MFP subunit